MNSPIVLSVPMESQSELLNYLQWLHTVPGNKVQRELDADALTSFATGLLALLPLDSKPLRAELVKVLVDYTEAAGVVPPLETVIVRGLLPRDDRSMDGRIALALAQLCGDSRSVQLLSQSRELLISFRELDSGPIR